MAAVYLEFYFFLCFIFTFQIHISAQFVNVAKGKTAYQSSYLDNSFKASTAVDGVTKQNGDNFMHTAIDQNYTWWEVDLGKLYFVHEVKIYFRSDYKPRRRGVQIYTNTAVNSSNTGHLCGTVTGRQDGSDIPDVVSFTCNVNARYVTVYQGTNNGEGIGTALDFLEVEVYACELNVKYDSNCDKLCEKRHCVNTNSSCDVQTGKCDTAGCTAGWTGTDCRKECNPGTYGKNCKSRCRNCRNKRCDRFSGNCTGGCIEGYEGILCKQECRSGKYGLDCSSTCGQCKTETCHFISGNCTGGCKDGYQGHLCKQPCDKGWYGPTCSRLCTERHCSGRSECNHISGKCQIGCEYGWTRQDCTVADQKTTETSVIILSSITALALIFSAAALILVIMVYQRRTKPTDPFVTFEKNRENQTTATTMAHPVYEAVVDNADGSASSSPQGPIERNRRSTEHTQHGTQGNQRHTNDYDALQVESVDQGSPYDKINMT